MKVHVEHDWALCVHRVFVTRPVGSGSEILRLGSPATSDREFGEPPTWVPTDPLSRVVPTFELPEGVLPAIVAAAGDVLPPSAATDRHLSDAVVVRDRLLSLVERLTEGASS